MGGEGDTYAQVLRLSSRQHGIISRPQLVALGVTEDAIRHWISIERLVRVFRGIFVAGRSADTDSALWMAGVLRGGPGAVLSGISAAAAWKIMEPSSLVQVARAGGRDIHEQGCSHHGKRWLSVRSTSLFVTDLTRIGPVPVMTPARTLIDLARSVSAWELRRVFLSAGHRGLLTKQSLEQCRTRGGSFKGHARLMELVDQWLPDTGKLRSPMESEFLLLCGKYGIPAPRTNFRIGNFEADCFWPGTRIVAELDSRGFHDDGFGFEDDRDKGNQLSTMGYTVLRFTYRMISRHSERVARILRRHLALAA